MNRRRILAISGIRSEYFFQRSIFEAIQKHPGLDLELVVAGAHLSPLHGYSVRRIEEDGFSIVARIESLLYSGRDAARVKSLAIELQILSHIVDARRPDWLLAAGDREDPLALAICGAYLNIPIAHYCAGDRVVGNVDDMVRHAISRVAHLLLTTSEDSRVRLIKSGEEKWRIHNVGHSGLDRIRSTPHMNVDELAGALQVPRIEAPYLIVIQHSLSSEIGEAGEQMRETMEAVAALGLQTFVIHPNSDAGSQQVVEVVRSYICHSHIHVFDTLEDRTFVNLLRGAAVLVGNSSLGLLEAPFLKLPVINVGRRQTARLHAENVFFVPHDRKAIGAQVRLILDDESVRSRVRNCSNPFGDGLTGPRVAELLAMVPIDCKLLNKDLTY